MISPTATSPAIAQRMGEGGRILSSSENLASPAVAGATARGNTSRKQRTQRGAAENEEPQRNGQVVAFAGGAR